MADVLGGEPRIKRADERYLPILSEQDTLEYQRYKQRAIFFNVTGRTREALIGFLFRKDPVMEAPGTDSEGNVKENQQSDPVLDSFIEDTTLSGQSFYDTSKDIAERVAGFGRCGTLVDWDEDEGQPFAVVYAAEDITNWKYERRNGKMALVLLVLHELDPKAYNPIDSERAADKYMHVLYDQWRVMELLDDGSGGSFVQCTIWRRIKEQGFTNKATEDAWLEGTGSGQKPGATTREEDFTPVNKFYPQRKGANLTDIPFVFHTPYGPYGGNVARSPMLDLALINLSLYRTSADLENARHFLGVPTPWAAGFSDKNQDLFLGATTAWVSSEPNARCGFLELAGTGLKSLLDAVEEKERQMAALGARMLDAQLAHQVGREAYATVALRQTSETAVLLRISLSLTQSLTNLLAWAYWWSSTVDTPEAAEQMVSYTLNTDFLGVTVTPDDATKLMQLYLQNGISFETLFRKLQDGEIIPPDRTVDEEKKMIQDGQSMFLELAQASGRMQPGQQPAGKSASATPGNQTPGNQTPGNQTTSGVQ